MAGPALVTHVSGDIESLRRALTEGIGLIKTTTAQMDKLNSSLQGDKLIAAASRMVVSLNDIGGASTQTAKEAQRMADFLTKAMDKLSAMGKEIDPSMTLARDQLRAVADQASHVDVSVRGMTSRVKEMALGYVTGMATLQGFEHAGSEMVSFLKDSIKEALEADKVQRQLTAALQAQGQAIPAVLDHYEALSKKYERLTVNSDEAIKDTERLLVEVGGVLPAQMDLALRATTDLAAGLGVELPEATKMVAKAFEDNFGTLKKAGVDIDEARAKAEGMSYVLGEIEKRFGGQAQSEAESYAGQIKQLGNAWKDFQEELGRGLIEMDAWKPLLSGISLYLSMVTTEVLEFFALLKNIPSGAQLFASPTAAVSQWIAATEAEMNRMADVLKRLKAAEVFDPIQNGQYGIPVGFGLNLEAARAQALWKKNTDDAKKATEAVQEYQKWKRELLTGVTDAERKQIEFEITLQKETTASVFVLEHKIGTLKDLLAIQKQVLTLQAAPPSVISVSKAPGVPGPSLGLTMADLENSAGVAEAERRTDHHLAQLRTYNDLMRLAGQLTLQFGHQDSVAWSAAAGGIQIATGVLQDYIKAIQAEDRAAAMATLTNNLLMASLTMGISLAIQAITHFFQKLQQYKHDRDALWGQLADFGIQAPSRDALGLGRDQYLDYLKKQLDDAKQRSQAVTDAIGRMTDALGVFGGRAPSAMRPWIESLIQSGKLTKDQVDAFRAVMGSPDYKNILQIAQERGLAESDLGSAYQQLKVNDLSKQYFGQLTQLQDIGAPNEAVLRAFADEFQGLIDAGTSIPKFLKPYFDQMTSLGLLHDTAGNTLADTLSLSFNDLQSPLDEAVDYLKQIRDLIQAQTTPTAPSLAVPRVPQSSQTDIGRGGSGGGMAVIESHVYLDGLELTKSVARHVQTLRAS